MSTQKQSETSKQKPKPAEPAAKATKKGEIELSEKELARTTGGGKPIHKAL